jgi:hypothetical protein
MEPYSWSTNYGGLVKNASTEGRLLPEVFYHEVIGFVAQIGEALT